MLCMCQSITKAQDHPRDLTRPACGKVCKLVCETKKLTSIGYGNECKSICLPGSSRAGCKHCATCYGECQCDPGECCQESAPKCEFCWRDWFACGCTRPRTVKVLTKWQAEKKICWYHWEVIDVACCDCVSKRGEPAIDLSLGIAQSQISGSFYKPAPDEANLGDVMPVTEDEWTQLAAAMTPEPQQPAVQVAADGRENNRAAGATPEGDATELQPKPPAPSIAERLERMLRK